MTGDTKSFGWKKLFWEEELCECGHWKYDHTPYEDAAECSLNCNCLDYTLMSNLTYIKNEYQISIQRD